MKIFVSENLKKLKQDVIVYKKGINDIFEAEILIGNHKELSENVEKFENLKFVQLLSSGYDSIDLEYLNQKNVLVANARGLYSDAIAEYCIAYILYEFKSIKHYYENQQKSEWSKDLVLTPLSDRKVLILGTGSIGQSISKRLISFDVHVDGLNSDGRCVKGFDQTFTFESVLPKLGSYDVVISSLPAGEHTNGRIDKEFFLAMQSEAIFINVGRGDVVNEADLLEVLDDHLSKVILDVFISEPLDSTSPFYTHPKVMLTPHNSASSKDSKANALRMVQENLDRYLNGEAIKNKISR